MKTYNQLSLENRHQIKALQQAGHTQTEIAETIGVDKSTISRELKRNIPDREAGQEAYQPDVAQKLTDQRHRDKSKHRRFSDVLKIQAREWLKEERLSPELISGRWQAEGTDGVSHETIYQWIWAGKANGDPEDKDLYKYLKHGCRRGKRGNRQDSRGQIKGRVSIGERPDVVGERERLGDIEVDLMIGKAHKSALLVLVDRSTLVTIIEKVGSRKADLIADRIVDRLGPIPNSYLKTLTFDNDKAFARHQDIAQALNAETFFTHPYSAWEKGTVENRIGVIRRFFPKGTDLREVGEERVKQVEQYLNLRPVRKFDYLNPIQQSLKYRSVALIA